MFWRKRTPRVDGIHQKDETRSNARRRGRSARPVVDALESRQLLAYGGAPIFAAAYNPTWPNWFPKAGTQLEDSDFATAAFQGLWGSVNGKGRNDLQTIQSAGFNTVRLYNWGPSREGRTATGQPDGKFDAHLPFLDTAQALGLKVIVPVSNYFLSNDKYAWNGQNPNAALSFNSAPRSIQIALDQFVASVTQNGRLDPAVGSIAIGNELDLGIQNDPGATAKLARADWWVVNLEQALQKAFPGQIPQHFLTIPVSNADQGNVPPSVNPNPVSWFQIFADGAQKGEYMPVGTVTTPQFPSKTFTTDVVGLSQYPWFNSMFFNSVNMFQSGAQLQNTLTQYSTGQPTGSTWSDKWPGYKPTVPLLITELGTTRYQTTGAEQAQAVLDQAQIVVNQLQTSTNNVMGATIFEFNDEPNKNGYKEPEPNSELFFGLEQYTTDQSHFRDGTVMYHMNTGVTKFAGGYMAAMDYPVYSLIPVTTSSGQTVLSQLKGIFSVKA
jgi:hypothetical protein